MAKSLAELIAELPRRMAVSHPETADMVTPVWCDMCLGAGDCGFDAPVPPGWIAIVAPSGTSDDFLICSVGCLVELAKAVGTSDAAAVDAAHTQRQAEAALETSVAALHIVGTLGGASDAVQALVAAYRARGDDAALEALNRKRKEWEAARMTVSRVPKR